MHATRFAALGDATRFRLVEMLSVEPLPVHVLTAAFSISRPAISRHLRVLKEAGVVIEEKSGRENLYRLQSHHLTPLTVWLATLDSPTGQPAATAEKPKKQKRAPRPKLAVAPIVPEVPVTPLPVEPAPTPEPEIKAAPEPKAKAQPKPKPKAEPVAKPVPAPSQNQMAWEF
jgi:DNA-binding transcriptional ArsR family regulator